MVTRCARRPRLSRLLGCLAVALAVAAPTAPSSTAAAADKTFRLEALATAADAPTNAATDLAEWLVSRGVPFRDAHAIVGAVVRRSLDDRIPLAELVESSPDLGPDAVFLVAPGVAVSRRTTAGGGGPDPVRAQLVAFTDRLATDRARS